MMKVFQKILMLSIAILVINCGTIKIDTDIDDAVDALLESADEAIDKVSKAADGELDADDVAIEHETGLSYLATYKTIVDTCASKADHLKFPKMRLFKDTETVEIFDLDDQSIASGEFAEDGLIELEAQFDSMNENDYLSCLCELEIDNELSCACEIGETSCNVLFESY